MKKLKFIIPAVAVALIVVLASICLLQINTLNKIEAPITQAVIPFDYSLTSDGIKIKDAQIKGYFINFSEKGKDEASQRQQEFSTLLKDYKVNEIFKKYFNIEDCSSPYLALTLTYSLIEKNSVLQSEKDTLTAFLNHKDGFAGVCYNAVCGKINEQNVPILSYSYDFELSPTTDTTTYVVLFRKTAIHFRGEPIHVDDAKREKSNLNENFTKKLQELKVDKILYKYFNFTEITSPYCCVQLAYELLDGNSINLIERYYLNKFVSAPEGYVEIFYWFKAD